MSLIFIYICSPLSLIGSISAKWFVVTSLNMELTANQFMFVAVMALLPYVVFAGFACDYVRGKLQKQTLLPPTTTTTTTTTSTSSSPPSTPPASPSFASRAVNRKNNKNSRIMYLSVSGKYHVSEGCARRDGNLAFL
jgi:hypothetical protein